MFKKITNLNTLKSNLNQFKLYFKVMILDLYEQFQSKGLYLKYFLDQYLCFKE